MNDSSRTPRRWFQFSLANILLAMLPLAVLCWLTNLPMWHHDEGQRVFLAIVFCSIAVGGLFRGIKGMPMGFLIGMGILLVGALVLLLLLVLIEIGIGILSQMGSLQ